MQNKKNLLVKIGVDILLLNFSYLILYYLSNKYLVGNFIFSYIFFINLNLCLTIFFNLPNRIVKYTDLDEYLIFTKIGGLFFAVNILFNYKNTNQILFLTSLEFLFLLLEFSYRNLIKFLYFNGKYKKAESLRRVLIVGAGDAGRMILKEIKLKDKYLNPVCFVDDDQGKKNSIIEDIKIVGNTKDILKITKNFRIDEIIIAIPSLSGEKLSNLVNLCQETRCIVKTLPNKSNLVDNTVKIGDIRDIKIDDLMGRSEKKLDESSIFSILQNKTILITGGGGSIGSELCRQILKFNPKMIVILENNENNAFVIEQELKRINKTTFINVVIANIREIDRIMDVFRIFKPDIVFHAAAHKHVPLMEGNEIEVVRNNIVGTYNVALASKENNVTKCVLISSDKAVRPTNIMGASKRYAEFLFQYFNTKKSNTKYIAVRFGNVLGSNGSVIPTFINQIKLGGPLTVTHPEITRYFMSIPEASRLVIQAAALGDAGNIFILDMGQPIKIDDLARKLIMLFGFIPGNEIKIEYTGLRPGEKLYEELIDNEERVLETKIEGIMLLNSNPINEKKLLDNFQILRDIEADQKSKIRPLLKEIVVNYESGENI